MTLALGQWKPPIGKYLGDLAGKLTCHHSRCPGCSTSYWIVECVSCGSKNYAYRLNTKQVMCKVRGFSLNFSAGGQSQQYESLAYMKRCQHLPKNVTLKTRIMHDKLTTIIYTCMMPKHYGYHV